MKKTLGLMFALVMMFGLVACGGGAEKVVNENANYEPTGIVMLYSSMQEEQLVAIQKGFEAQYPNLKLEYYFASTSKVITKMATEMQGGKVDADVVWVGDPADYASFKAQGMLQTYSSPEAEGTIDEAYIDSEGYFTGARMMNMGIAYNTVLVSADEAPQSWNDLLDAKWNDQIVMTDPGASGTSKYWANAIMSSDKYGEAYIQALKNNGCYLESGTTATHTQIAASAYKVGVCLDYVTSNLVNEGSPIAFIYPTDTVSIFSPIGLVANCANEENGKLLYDFILSAEGQKILVDNGLISVRDDVDQAGSDVAEIASKALASDFSVMVNHGEENISKFDKIFGL